MLKDIGVSGAQCVPESTVTVVKYGDDYSYCLHLKCTDKTGTNILYEEKNKRGSCSKYKLVTLTYNVKIRWPKDDLFSKGVVKGTFKGFVNDAVKFKWNGSWMIDKTSNNNCVWLYGETSPLSKSHICVGNHSAATCSSKNKIMNGWICGNLTTN